MCWVAINGNHEYEKHERREGRREKREEDTFNPTVEFVERLLTRSIKDEDCYQIPILVITNHLDLMKLQLTHRYVHHDST